MLSCECCKAYLQAFVELDQSLRLLPCRAPELADIDATVTAESNIWAHSIILLEMYTGPTWPFGFVTARLHRCPADDWLPEPLAANSLQCLLNHTSPHLRPSAADVTQV